jgi:1,2-dihydroxy-3-keto-5-methylthiopentene dioxygenase
MSLLTVSPDSGPDNAEVIREHAAIAGRLGELGVRFERWETDRALPAAADPQSVLAAYADEVDRLNAQYGFQSLDVVGLGPDHPQKDELRAKFLGEHTHADFEVRFFVGGSGLFYLHPDQRVYCVWCEQGDLISVPAGTPHWFDMGSRPDFKCIRFFTVADGWVGAFTGSHVPGRFPDFDQFLARYR